MKLSKNISGLFTSAFLRQGALLAVLAFSLAGCGSSESEPPLIGKFVAGEKTVFSIDGVNEKKAPVDNDVSGINYSSGKRTGYTDDDGRFYYKYGETIHFFIGTVSIGSVAFSEENAEDRVHVIVKKSDNIEEYYDKSTSLYDDDRIVVVSAVDFFDDPDNEDRPYAFVTDSNVTNMWRFLVALDSDANLSNGIDISTEMTEKVVAVCGENNLSEISFEDTGDSETVINGINSKYGDNLTLEDNDAEVRKVLYSALAKYDATPVALVNVGDGLTGGAQSGAANQHEMTQYYSFPKILPGYMAARTELKEWINPYLEMDADRNKTRRPEQDSQGNELDELSEPGNLGVAGAKAGDIVNEKTSDNPLLSELMRPVVENVGSPLTQLEVAQYAGESAEKQGHETIFTVWAGMSDIYSSLIDGFGSNIVVSGDSVNVDDVINDIDAIIDGLLTVAHSRIFIANIPYPDSFGAVFYRDDLETLAKNEYLANISSPDLSALPEKDGVSLHAFQTVIAQELAVGKTNDDINNALGLLGDKDILSEAEAAVLKGWADRINTHLQSRADGSSRIVLVDLNGLFGDIADEKFQVVSGELMFSNAQITTEEDGSSNSDEVIVKAADPDGAGGYPVSRVWGSGGFFSMDGYHPSHTGYLLIANSFLNAINDAEIGVNMGYYTKQTDDEVVQDTDYRWLVNADTQWSSEPYREYDGDGFPKGPGKMYIADSTEDTVLVIDPELKTLIDCDDYNVESDKENTLPEAVSKEAGDCY